MSAALDAATKPVLDALYVEINGGELAPITEVYLREGVEIIVRNAVRDGVRAYLDALDPAPLVAAKVLQADDLAWPRTPAAQAERIIKAIRP